MRLLPLLIAAGLLAGCGSAGADRLGPAQASAQRRSCTSGEVTLTVGAQLQLTGCPPVTHLQVASGAEHVQLLAGSQLRAATAGTAVVQVSRSLPCSAGQVCSHLRQQLATITVTVRR